MYLFANWIKDLVNKHSSIVVNDIRVYILSENSNKLEREGEAGRGKWKCVGGVKEEKEGRKE